MEEGMFWQYTVGNCSRLVLLLSQAHLLTFFLVNVIMLESVASKFYNSATFLLRGLTWLYVGEDQVSPLFKSIYGLVPSFFSDMIKFINGNYTTCIGECLSMGYLADETKRNGGYYLKTTCEKSFCGTWFLLFVCAYGAKHRLTCHLIA